MNVTPTPAADEPRLPLIAAAGLIVAVTLAVYWHALDAGFVGDDFMILHRLRSLAGAADVLRFFRGEFFEYYRPMGFVSHAADWAIAGSFTSRTC
jgi:Uma2 family endonuclease